MQTIDKNIDILTSSTNMYIYYYCWYISKNKEQTLLTVTIFSRTVKLQEYVGNFAETKQSPYFFK